MARALRLSRLSALTVGICLGGLACNGETTPVATGGNELTPAEAAEVEHEVVRIPIQDLVVDDPCVGELVSYDGFLQFVLHTGRNRGLDPEFFQHRIDNTHVKLTGVGLTSGAKYQVNSLVVFHIQSEDLVEAFPVTANLVGKDLVTRQGDGVVSILVIKFMLVIDANDQVRVDRFELTSECP